MTEQTQAPQAKLNTQPNGRIMPGALARGLGRLPWWALAALLLGVLFIWQVSSDDKYQEVFRVVSAGIGLTLAVTAIAFSQAVSVGLFLAFMRMSKNPVIYHAATFYVEIIRGVPMLVLLLYVAFVLVPGVIDGLNAVGRAAIAPNFIRGLNDPLKLPFADMVNGLEAPNLRHIEILTDIGRVLTGIRLRDISNLSRVIIALVVAYSAFLSEVFRAGIESIDKGQMEAARSLGMTYRQAMRYVILPQAIRNVLPPLGNDFIAMLKDSSLVSVLGVQEITGLGRVYAAGNFRFWQTYNAMAFLYLTMTLLLSLGVRALERYISRGRR
jgi:polar amino acid transport system permease protein